MVCISDFEIRETQSVLPIINKAISYFVNLSFGEELKKRLGFMSSKMSNKTDVGTPVCNTSSKAEGARILSLRLGLATRWMQGQSWLQSQTLPLKKVKSHSVCREFWVLMIPLNFDYVRESTNSFTFCPFSHFTFSQLPYEYLVLFHNNNEFRKLSVAGVAMRRLGLWLRCT